MNHLSIRLRLTLFVTVTFVVALIAAGAIARQRLETTLVDTARTNIEQTLSDSFFAGPPDVEGDVTIDIQGVTRFVFTDSDGAELGLEEFASLVNDATAAQLAELGFFFDPEGLVVNDMFVVEQGELPMIEGATVEGATVEAVTVASPVLPIGEPMSADTADEIVMSQLVRIGDEELLVSVATPRQPLDDSLGAFTALGLILIPVLGAGVAAATWLTTSRVLRPVEDIRRQVEQTDSDHMTNHVPRSGNGDEIDRLAGTMNDMLDRLRIASDRQRQFVSDASHELRSPITATLATLETTDTDLVVDRWPEIAATLTAEQSRLARLVDDLLMLATVDEGRAGTDMTTVDLDELLLVEASRPHQVEVRVNVIDPHRLSGNTRLLERCVANLVENATRHAVSIVDLTVATSTNGTPVITVDDDGPGIPEDRLETIFERFVRVDDARNRRDGGAGLGLSIAREIARQHGATLSASNRPNGGARFELVFDETQGSHP